MNFLIKSLISNVGYLQMKKISLLITGILFCGGAIAAITQPVQRRSSVTPNSQTTVPTTSARSAVRSTVSGTTTKPTVAARAGTTVAARAATKQNVAQTGIAVTAATANTIVSEECKTKYFGCMDSFCMLENDNGGRCLCSDRKSELDIVLTEIEKLDAQSRDMATTGVEKIELGSGDKASYVLNAAQSAAGGYETTQSNGRVKTRSTLDLSIFDTQPTFGFDDEVENADLSLIEDKTGDELHTAVRDICTQQIPECSKDIRMLQMMYTQTIKSDCNAYENYLKKMKTESANKLQVAERALRDAALEAYESANKWDLGQCVVEMRKCMQDDARGGCGTDWAGCVGIAAAENASSTRNRSGTVDIEGSATKIQIAASTYDALLSKKPICESVTNYCVSAVSKDKNAVWNTFLREIAPTLKSAELLAESNRRTDCVGNISECFRKGCADTMTDETSYDLCLTQPESMLSICKVQLNECGISTTSADEAEKSTIWNYVVAKLLSMRVDSCTTQIKNCLQSEDRCGTDYSQCWGMDYDNIIALCPSDKLVACSNDEDYISDVISGIMLNIDNNLLYECQAAVEAKMEELCGDGLDCSVSFGDEGFGAESLVYNSINPNKVSISGLLDFSKLTKLEEKSEDRKSVKISVKAGTMSGNSATSSNQGLKNIADKINRVISMLSTDTKIAACVNGRDMSQVTRRTSANVARFPNLLDNYIPAIITYGLEAAQKNYNAKLDSFKEDAMDLVKERVEAANATDTEIECIDAAILPAK